MNDKWPIDKLHEWDKNPRNITTEGFSRLKKQIQKLGQYKPLLITPDGEVIGGNMRLKAYRDLGVKEAWVSVVNPKDENEKLEYALSDNDRAGYYDDDLLANLTAEMPDFNWADYSVDLKEPTNLGDLLDQFKEVIEDEVPEVSNEPAISKLGEVYQLGRHRLMCGDSTKIEDVEKLMNGQKADMVFTDPPYGMDLDTDYSTIGGGEGKSKKYEKVIGDDKPYDPQPLFGMFGYCDEILLFGADYYLPRIPHWDKGTWLIWDKRETENYDKVIGSSFEVLWSKKKRRKEILRYEYVSWGKRMEDGEKVHPTMKPVTLLSRILRMTDGELVVDLFGGSGSTLIACEQTNRTCFCSEIDNKYIDVIIKRWMKFTGKRAYKIIDADGNPCNIPVQFVDESFMDGKTLQESTEALSEESQNTVQKNVGQLEQP